MKGDPAINNVKRVMLPGQAWGLAAPGADGPIFVTGGLRGNPVLHE